MDRYAEAKKICLMLTRAGHPTMLAGGCVRDRLFGLDPSDFDLATSATPQEVIEFFGEQDMQTIPVGVEHGTVIVVGQWQNLEITTLRHDLACDGRWAEVAFSKDFAEDAKRRDFTINALFEDADGKIHDYVGGQEDIAKKRLRFVGDPGERIEEDYLRILRYFRFLARLGWEPDKDAMTAVAAHVSGLSRLSNERVFSELERTLTGAHYPAALPFMAESGVLEALFSWHQPETLPQIIAIAERLQVEKSTLHWFTLVVRGSNGALVGDAQSRELSRLRFPRLLKKALMTLTRLFANLENAEVALPILLKLEINSFLDAGELKQYFQCCQEVAGWSAPTPVTRLLEGMATMASPRPPQEALMEVPPQERGFVLELVKIYWYLGLCRAKTQMRHLMKARREYGRQLNMEHLSTMLARADGTF